MFEIRDSWEHKEERIRIGSNGEKSLSQPYVLEPISSVIQILNFVGGSKAANPCFLVK